MNLFLLKSNFFSTQSFLRNYVENFFIIKYLLGNSHNNFSLSHIQAKENIY
jgi:hypothetical protein